MRVILAGLIAAGTLAAPLTFGAEYRFTLVDYPGASMTGLTGINNYGQAPGNAIVGSDRIPFLYDAKTGSIVNLSIVPGEASTIVGGINNAGITVGGTFLEDEITGAITGTAYVRNADGSFNLFSHPDAAFRTEARAISDTGLITGYHDTFDGTTAFLYDPAADTFTDFAPSLATLSTGINAKGAVVGRVLFHVNDDPCDGVADQGSHVQYGFVRFPDGVLTYFQVNGRPTRAGDIDNTGLIYGEVYAPDLSESRIFKTRVSREPCVALTIPRRDLRGKSSGVGYTVRGVNVRSTIAGFARDSNGAHGYVARKLDQQ